MFILAGGHLGNMLKKTHRHHHHDVHASFGSTVSACCINWHTVGLYVGAAWFCVNKGRELLSLRYRDSLCEKGYWFYLTLISVNNKSTGAFTLSHNTKVGKPLSLTTLSYINPPRYIQNAWIQKACTLYCCNPGYGFDPCQLPFAQSSLNV